MYSHENAKTKQLGKKTPSNSIKAIYKDLPRRKGKLNMITSTVANKFAVVRSFGSSSIAGCSEKSIVITKSFESYSELFSSSLEMKVL